MWGKRNPLFPIAIVFIAGIIIGYHIEISLIIRLIGIVLILLLLFLAVIIKNKNLNSGFICLLLLSFFVFGWFKISIDRDNNVSVILQKIYERNEKVIISGIVDEKPVLKNYRLSFPVKIKKIYIGKNVLDIETNALINIRIDTVSKKIKSFEYGDEIFAAGKLIEPKNTRNPGEFDYSKYLQLKDIQAIFKINDFHSVILRSKNNGEYIEGNLIQPLREKIHTFIDKKMGRVEGAFLKGLLIGDRSGIPEEVKEDFLNAGVMHVLAVSGLNVVFVILIFSAFFSVFINDRILKTILIIISLLFYMFLTGSSPSIVRATIMGIIFLLGSSMERKTSPLNLLAISAVIILIIDSRELFDLGFQLSFLCVFALIYAFPILNNFFKMKRRNKIVDILLESITGSFAVILILFPILAMTSGKISLISIIANLVVVPIANMSLAVGFLQVIVSGLSSFISGLLVSANQLCLWINLFVIKYFGDIEFLSISAYDINVVKTLLYYGFCFLLLYAIKTKRWMVGIITIVILANTIVWSFIIDRPFDKLKITFIDSGQGDATLLQLPNGINILIDAGPKQDGFDTGEKIIYPFLRREGVNKVQLCFISHFHDDHYGGLPFLIQKKMIETIYYNDSTGCGTICKYLDSLSKVNNVIFKKSNFDTLRIDNLKIYMLSRNFEKSNLQMNENVQNSEYDLNSVAKNKKHQKNQGKNSLENNKSMVMKILYGNSSLLFTGDVERNVEESLSDKYGKFLQSDILKVGHHGSNSSTTENFIQMVKPKVSIIFAGLGNRFKFPSKKVVDRLRSNGSTVLRTDLEKAIIFETDGKNIKRTLWN
jgi:competence protein ComEC